MLKAALLAMVGRPVAADSLAQYSTGTEAGRYQLTAAYGEAQAGIRSVPRIPMRFQRNKNSGRPFLEEEAAPNLSTKNFLNKPVNDAESLRSRQPTHILKVLGDGGPGEGAFFKTPLPPEILYS